MKMPMYGTLEASPKNLLVLNQEHERIIVL